MTFPGAARIARPWTVSRAAGSLLLGLWLLFAVWVLLYLAGNYEVINSYGGKLVRGLGITLVLVAIPFALGAIVSVPVAMGRMSDNPLWSRPSFCFVYFVRGTPLIAQMFLVYYGAGSFREELSAIGMWWLFRDAFGCAILVLTMNTAAYQTEILRGAIQSVPKGQQEGGEALGLSRRAIFWKITIPQALIIALRPYGNEIVLLLKGSAIASVITVLDLMGETRRAFSRTFDYTTYLLAAIMYLFIVEALRRVWARFEAHLTRHLRPRTSDASK